jgi:hypothetical protein
MNDSGYGYETGVAVGGAVGVDVEVAVGAGVSVGLPTTMDTVSVAPKGEPD